MELERVKNGRNATNPPCTMGFSIPRALVRAVSSIILVCSGDDGVDGVSEGGD